jgi:excisionase family DNA binding protein
MTAQNDVLEPDADLLTVRELAKQLKVSASWIYKSSERGQIPCVRIGALIRFEPRAIQAWLAERRSASLTVTGIESVTSKSAPSK